MGLNQLKRVNRGRWRILPVYHYVTKQGWSMWATETWTLQHLFWL